MRKLTANLERGIGRTLFLVKVAGEKDYAKRRNSTLSKCLCKKLHEANASHCIKRVLQQCLREIVEQCSY